MKYELDHRGQTVSRRDFKNKDQANCWAANVCLRERARLSSCHCQLRRHFRGICCGWLPHYLNTFCSKSQNTELLVRGEKQPLTQRITDLFMGKVTVG